MSFDPRNLALVIILVGAALVTWVFARVGVQPTTEGPSSEPAPQGHYLLGAVLHGADESGRFYYQIVAERVEQAASGDSIEFEGICVEYSPEHDVRWDICAASGFSDANSVYLEDEVRMVYAAAPGEAETTFETDELLVDTANFLAATDRQVTMRRNRAVVNALGLELDLNTDDWTLGSKDHDDADVTIVHTR